MQWAPLAAQMDTFIIDMIQNIVITILVEHFLRRISSDLLRMIIPEGDFARGVHKVDAFFHIFQNFLINLTVFHSPPASIRCICHQLATFTLECQLKPHPSPQPMMT